MRFKFPILGGLIGLNLVFGQNQNQNIVTLTYTGSKEDLKKIEKALRAGKEVCFNAATVPINLRIENCKVSKEEGNNIKKIGKTEKKLTQLPDRVCGDSRNDFVCKFTFFKLLLDSTICSFLKMMPIIPKFLCDCVYKDCKSLNSCSFSLSGDFSSDKPFVFVGRMNSNLNCFGFNFDFSGATQAGMFILDNDNVTVDTNLSFNIKGNHKSYFYWHVQNNWSGSGNVNVNFKNLAGFYFSAASITGSTNFTFNGSRLKNFSFFVNQKLTGSGKISLNLNSYINLVSIDIPEIDSKQLEVSLKKAKKVIISVKNLTNSSKVCIKVKSCPGVMLWLEY